MRTTLVPYRKPYRKPGYRFALMAAAVGLLVSACRRTGPPVDGEEQAAATMPRPSQVAPFEDATTEYGIDFVLRTASEGSYPMTAIMGGGFCLFDADSDGDLDLYFVDGGGGGNRLFLREGARFADRTQEAGLGLRGVGTGCASGDVDNDGDRDLFVSNWGPDAFFRNLGGGRFRDESEQVAAGGDGWSSSAVFFDYDLDGFLDLFVARYVAYDPERRCALEGGRPDYCGPAQFPGLPDLLYRNRAGAAFDEVARSAGIATSRLRGLGVLVADLDDDGRIDLYVANDSDPNNLWLNRGDGTFVDDGALLGVAYNRYGVGEAGMGVATGDVDGDGDLDLFVSHLIEETNTFYENRGPLGFEDTTASIGLGLSSMRFTGFGVALFDVDLDRDLDLAVANGAVKVRPRPLSGREEWFWNDYAEPNLLFAQVEGTFVDASSASGDFGAGAEISRGLAVADLDDDGDEDLVVVNVEAPAVILRNTTQERRRGTTLSQRRWLELRTLLPELHREAVGARVEVATTLGRRVVALAPPGSYLTDAPPRRRLALADDELVEGYSVRWPGGAVERFGPLGGEGVVVLERGAGDAVD